MDEDDEEPMDLAEEARYKITASACTMEVRDTDKSPQLNSMATVHNQGWEVGFILHPCSDVW